MSELRDQHKAFAEWFLQQNPVAPNAEDLAWAAWKAALAEPEAEPPRDEWREAVLGALEICMILNEANRDDPERAMSDLMGWEPRDEWRPANEPPTDGRRVLIWVATESGEETFRPAYCPVGGWTSVFDGETLVAWRDVTPPTEGAR